MWLWHLTPPIAGISARAVREARGSERLVEADGGVEGSRLRAVAGRCLGNGTWQMGKG